MAGFAEQGAGGGGELWGVAHNPEERAGIEQEVQSVSPLKAANTSAGNGSKNAVGNSTPRSAAKPSGRGLAGILGKGRISAMGILRLHKRIVSPVFNADR